MPLPTTQFFDSVLRTPYDKLRLTRLALTHLSGSFRYDGCRVEGVDRIEVNGAQMTGREAAQLLMIFDGSRVCHQNRHDIGDAGTPPGSYFTIVHPGLVHEGCKNRVGLYKQQPIGVFTSLPGRHTSCFPLLAGRVAFKGGTSGIHLQNFFLRRQAPALIGTVAFALCAITAHRLGYDQIALMAAGVPQRAGRLVGYFVWPKLGFDAPIGIGELDGYPHLETCLTIQDIIAIDESWWQRNGKHRWMAFNLAADSRSWRKLLDYLRNKELI